MSGDRARSAMVQRTGFMDSGRLSAVGDTRCTVLLVHSSLTETGTCGTYLRDSRHVTEHSERVCPRPAAIGYVSHGRLRRSEEMT
jgi:hypothetical protein